MRTRLTGLIAGMLMLTIVFPAAANAGDDPFRFEGAGYGHGIGLPGYGVKGMVDAIDGVTGEEVVTYYYPGTSISTLPGLSSFVKEDVWVNVYDADRDGGSRIDFEADVGALGLCHGLSDCPDASIGTPVPGESWSFRTTGSGTCRFYRGSTAMGSNGNCFARVIVGDDSTDRIHLDHNDTTYAYGQLMIRPQNSTNIHGVMSQTLEEYMRGIGEMPLSWPIEALKAQSLASRTYASYKIAAIGPYTSFSDDRKSDCWCHIYDDTRSQVFRGWNQEGFVQDGIEFGLRWIEAVEATDGKFITHPDTTYTVEGLINSFFGSSSGGRTEENGNYWGGTTYPYLQSVDDPYSSVSQHNPWMTDGEVGVPKTHSTVASKLGWDKVERITVTEFHNSTSAKTVLFEGWDSGEKVTTTRTGREVRGLFGLRSHFIDRVCRDRGPYDDDGCSFFEHNIFNISDAGFVGTLPGNNYNENDVMTRSTMAKFLYDGLDIDPSGTDYFTDDDSDPNEDEINALAAAGIVVGYGDGTYGPNDPVNRAEMAVYLTRALDIDITGTVEDPFPDVPGDSWFGVAVAEVLDLGITVGHQDGNYHPFDPTTRGQMAAFIDRAFLGGF